MGAASSSAFYLYSSWKAHEAATDIARRAADEALVVLDVMGDEAIALVRFVGYYARAGVIVLLLLSMTWMAWSLSAKRFNYSWPTP